MNRIDNMSEARVWLDNRERYHETAHIPEGKDVMVVRYLIAEVERLEKLISDEPRCDTYVPGYFQKLWESCCSLSEKAAYKFVLRHLIKQEDIMAWYKREVGRWREQVERLGGMLWCTESNWRTALAVCDEESNDLAKMLDQADKENKALRTENKKLRETMLDSKTEYK